MENEVKEKQKKLQDELEKAKKLVDVMKKSGEVGTNFIEEMEEAVGN